MEGCPGGQPFSIALYTERRVRARTHLLSRPRDPQPLRHPAEPSVPRPERRPRHQQARRDEARIHEPDPAARQPPRRDHLQHFIPRTDGPGRCRAGFSRGSASACVLCLRWTLPEIASDELTPTRRTSSREPPPADFGVQRRAHRTWFDMYPRRAARHFLRTGTAETVGNSPGVSGPLPRGAFPRDWAWRRFQPQEPENLCSQMFRCEFADAVIGQLRVRGCRRVAAARSSPWGSRA